MKRSLVRSTIILSIATLLSKILGSIFRIPLQNIAGDEVFGIFSLVYPVYMVALILSVAGIPMAISQIIAEARSDHNVTNTMVPNGRQNDTQLSIIDVVNTAKWLTLIFGILSFLVITVFSTQLSLALGGTSTRPALIVVSLTLLIAPYMAVYRGFFQGYEDMVPTAVSQVLEQMIRVSVILTFAVVLVQQSYSHSFIAGGVMIGSPIGALVSLIYLEIKYRRYPLKEKKYSYSWRSFKILARKILYVSLPISVGAITMALFNVIDSLTIPYSLQLIGSANHQIHYLYGIYSRGLTLVQIATVFPSSIILPLIPLLTKLQINRESEKVQAIIKKSYRMTHLISWPMGIGLFVLSGVLNVALFENAQGTLILSIIHFSSIFTSLTILGTGILQGLNKARQGAIIIICGVVCKALLNIIGVHWIGLIGAAYATLILYILLFIANSIAIYRVVPYKVIDTSLLKIVIASLVMGSVVGFALMFINLEDQTRFFDLIFSVLMVGIGAVIYAIVLWISKGIDQSDLRTLPGLHRFFKKR